MNVFIFPTVPFKDFKAGEETKMHEVCCFLVSKMVAHTVKPSNINRHACIKDITYHCFPRKSPALSVIILDR